jgi:acyl-CoA synthetase (AMP-forming)/AMP-acid ligase II
MSISTGISTGTSATPVIASAWPDPEVPDLSLPDALLAVAAERPGEAAITDAASGRTLSYGELAGAMRRVAAGLAAHGLRPGDTFAILALNSPEWLVACFGAMAAGGKVTGLNPMCTPGEVAAQLGDSGARFVLTETAFLPSAQAAAELMAASRADNRIPIIVMNGKEPGKLDFPALQHTGKGCRTGRPTRRRSRCCRIPAGRRGGPRASCSATARSSPTWCSRSP